MNSDNFSVNQKSIRYIPEDKKPEPQTDLSGGKKAALLALSSLLMLACGAMNMFGALSSYPEALLGAFIISALIYIVVGGAVALLAKFSLALSFIPCAVSLVGTLLLGGAVSGGINNVHIAFALLSLFPAVGGIAIALSMKKGAKRSTSILIAALALGVFTLAIILGLLTVSGASLSLDTFIEELDRIRLSFIASTEAQAKEIAELYGVDPKIIDAEEMINSVFNTLPAASLLVFALSAFFSQLSMLAFSRICGVYGALDKKDTEFSVSPTTSLMFGIVFIIFMFCSELNTFTVVVQNLLILLEWPLALIGLRSILPRRVGNMVRVGCFPLAMTAFLFVTSPDIAVLFLAVIGSFGGIKQFFKDIKDGFSKKA